MMKFDALCECVLLKFGDIEVWIGGNEVKHFFFPVTEPILPADIPTLYEYTVEAVLSAKSMYRFVLAVVAPCLPLGLRLAPICFG